MFSDGLRAAFLRPDRRRVPMDPDFLPWTTLVEVARGVALPALCEPRRSRWLRSWGGAHRRSPRAPAVRRASIVAEDGMAGNERAAFHAIVCATLAWTAPEAGPCDAFLWRDPT